eukprot:381063_1
MSFAAPSPSLNSTASVTNARHVGMETVNGGTVNQHNVHHNHQYHDHTTNINMNPASQPIGLNYELQPNHSVMGHLEHSQSHPAYRSWGNDACSTNDNKNTMNGNFMETMLTFQPPQAPSHPKLTNKQTAEKVHALYNWDDKQRTFLQVKILNKKVSFRMIKKEVPGKVVVEVHALFEPNGSKKLCKICSKIMSTGYASHGRMHINVYCGLTSMGTKPKTSKYSKHSRKTGDNYTECTICNAVLTSNKQFLDHLRLHNDII